MATGVMSAQYLTKDFEDSVLTSGGWTTQVPVDTTDWYVTNYQGGSKYAQISNYNGSNNVASEAWLISPSIDLSSSTSPVLAFETVMKWSGPAIEVLVSTDYSGTGAPSAATWTDITSGATLDVNDQAWGSPTPSGEVSLSSYMTSSVYIAFKYTGSTNDGSTWQVDNIEVAEAGNTGGGSGGGSGAAVDKSIYEIQSNVSSADISYYVDSVVNTGGIVTAVNLFQGAQKGYYIQSGVGAYSGIYVYDNTNIVQRGDSITLTGTVEEYYESTQLGFVSNVTIVNQFNDVPATLISTAGVANEMYESVLCKVVNATCGSLPSGANYNEWDANDGSGVTSVDDFLFLYTPSVGTSYNITGVVAYAFSAWKMYPRDANDVSVYSSIEENAGVLTNVYPNPSVNGIVTVEVSEATDLVVMDLLGNVVLSQSLLNTVNTVDVSNLAAGNYVLKVGSSVQQLMIK